jgi:hypothetical protein
MMAKCSSSPPGFFAIDSKLRYKVSLHLAGTSRAQTPKKQAIARGVLAETAVVRSNMGYSRELDRLPCRSDTR